MLVRQVAHVQPGLPVTLGCVIAQGRAEYRVGVGVVAVGVIDGHLGYPLCIDPGEEALGPVVTQFALVVMHRQAGQAVVAKALVVTVVEVAEGVALTQAQLAAITRRPQAAQQAGFHTLVHGGAGVELIGRRGVGVWQYREQFVPYLGVVPGQAPLSHRAVAPAAKLQSGSRLVLQFDRLALGARGGSAACGEAQVGAVDQRPGVRRLHRTTEIAEQLQVWCQLVAQAYARGVVPVVQAGLAATLRIGHITFTAGVDSRQASGQPKVVGDLQVVADDLWLTTGLAAIYTRRESDVTYPQEGGKTSLHDWDYAPRVGLRYQLTPDLQLFGNLSRSVEAPHPWSLIYSSNIRFPAGSGPATGAQRDPVKLQNQTATTLEIGGRGDSTLGQWSLAWYYAQVHHELLSVLPDANATTPYELNASPTVHQGVEASLLSPLWSPGNGGQLSLRQSYTFSDFHYRDDDRFGDNRLPGLPMHYYQGELRYDWPQGFFAAVNTQWVSKVAVDYANSYYADPYALFGATLGYNAPKGDWQTWVDMRNLTDKHYAATVTPGYDDKGLDAARSTPGEGMAVYVGVSWSLL